MKQPGQDHDEREWQAQERALREVHGGRQAPAEDITLARYRDIAKALRQPLPRGLPPGFAARVAHIAAERSAPTVHTMFEQVLVRALAVIFALSALLALGVYGSRLLAMLQAATGAAGLRWTLALLACIGLSWSLDWLRRRLRDEHDGDRPMHHAA